MKEGIITKGVGGFYDVLTQEGMVQCRARGIFRKDSIIPMVGDWVIISVKDKAITEILPRKNQLIRPAVANIDLLGIVIAPTHPEPDYYLVDKLALSAESSQIQVLLIINKIDLVESSVVDEIIEAYSSTGYPIVAVSCKEEIGFQGIKSHIKDKILTLAGQSGVGKSSIINFLYPEKVLETGELSHRSSRGRHTTRYTKLLVLPSGGMLVDTPGFSTINMKELDPEELPYLYPEFSDHANGCRFNGCMHDQEPDCKVKEAVVEGALSQGRYQRYIRILNELRELRRNIW
jgi:ribosome biogenesis GTPase